MEENREGSRDRLKGTEESRQAEMTGKGERCRGKRMLKAKQPDTHRNPKRSGCWEVRGDAGWCQRWQDRTRSVVGGGEGVGRCDDSMHIREKGESKDGEDERRRQTDAGRPGTDGQAEESHRSSGLEKQSPSPCIHCPSPTV